MGVDVFYADGVGTIITKRTVLGPSKLPSRFGYPFAPAEVATRILDCLPSDKRRHVVTLDQVPPVDISLRFVIVQNILPLPHSLY